MVTMSSIGVTPSSVATGEHEKSANGANARYADTSEDAGATILQALIQVLTMLKSRLNEPALQADINRRLHDSESLPDKTIVPLAAKAVDVLHEIEQMLQPAQLVLADHFLGYVSSKCLVAAVSLKVPLHTLEGHSFAWDAAVLPGNVKVNNHLLHNCSRTRSRGL